MMGAERERCHWDSVPLYLVCWLGTERVAGPPLLVTSPHWFDPCFWQFVRPSLIWQFSAPSAWEALVLACVVFGNLDVL
jgi:hypothetical protein